MTSLRICSDIFHVWEEDVDLGNHWEPEGWELDEWDTFLHGDEFPYGEFIYEGGFYNLQCLVHGSIGAAEHGSDLEQRCIQHEEKGFLDALCVGTHECWKCQFEEEQRDRMYYEYDMDIDFGPYDEL